MSKKMLSFSEKLKVYKRLKEVCHKRGDLAIYDSGHDDGTVAKEFGCTSVNVASVRKEMIGKTTTTRQISGHTPAGSLYYRVRDIEDYLTRQHPDWRDTTKKE